MRLLPEEASFFFWAAAQLAPDAREVFAERVASILAGHPDPGPGDCNRAVRAAHRFVGAARGRRPVTLGPRIAAVRTGVKVTTRSQQGQRGRD